MASTDEIQLGLQLHQSGDLSQAARIYRNILTNEPDNSDALHLLGVIEYQLGHADNAIHLIERAIALNPNLPYAYNNLGEAFRSKADFDKAIANYQKSLNLKPDYSEAFNNLGIAQQAKGDMPQALESYQKAIALSPQYIEAHNNLALALQADHQFEAAIKSYENVLAIDPADIEAHNGLGVTLKSLGRLDEALTCFNKALAINSDYADAYNNMGTVALERKKFAEADRFFQKATLLKPNDATALHNLGKVYEEIGENQEALQCYEKARSLKPDCAEIYNNLGNVYRSTRQPDQAIASYQKSLNLKPDFAMAHANLGTVYQDLGDFDNARTSYRTSMAIDPLYTTAHRHFAFITKFTEYNKEIRQIENCLTDLKLSNEQRMNLCFALGKIFEDLKNYNYAFNYFHEGNQLYREAVDYSLDKDRILFQQIKTIFSKEFFAKNHAVGCTDTTPIFILGMPRSGTSLAEQILASHPCVYGAGELEELNNLICLLPGSTAMSEFPENFSQLNHQTLFQLGQNYVQQIRSYSLTKQFITDKMPHNFLLVGIIKTILPNAKIIHCQRDPMDNCLSLYKNYFQNAHYYSYDMNELGQYYALYQDLMMHWQKVIPSPFYDLNYEHLISNAKDEIEKLLDFCGLEWDDACLAFHKTNRRVTTASTHQVRQPLYQDSLKLWQHYGDKLNPIKAALEIS